MHIINLAQKLAHQVLSGSPEVHDTAVQLTAAVNAIKGANQQTSETHQLTFATNPYAGILPLLERIHRVYPETPLLFESAYDGTCVTLTIGMCPYNIKPGQHKLLLSKAADLLNDYLDRSPRDESGCAICGAHSGALCEVDCLRMNTKLLLDSMQELLND
jgi:hypothetical protein